MGTRLANHDSIVYEWNPELIVFGLPINLDGTSNEIVKKIRNLGQIFLARYLTEVHYIDERLSSKMAVERMKPDEILGGFHYSWIDT